MPFPKLLLPLTLLAWLALVVAFVVLAPQTSYQPFDLSARTFGLFFGTGVGILCSLIWVIVHGIRKIFTHGTHGNTRSYTDLFSRFFSFRVVPCDSVPSVGEKNSFLFPLASRLSLLLLLVVSMGAIGYGTGEIIDLEYAKANGNSLWAGTGFYLSWTIYVLSLTIAGIQTFCNSQNTSVKLSPLLSLLASRFSLLFVLTLAMSVWIAYLCKPALILEPRKLDEGVYIFNNDTAYNVRYVNIYSCRCSGFSHSGMFFITQRPREINAIREQAGLKPLPFKKLQRGYYAHNVSMVVPDVDGFANYQSRCFPRDNAYTFDIVGLKNYLDGRTSNDLLCPAIRIQKIPSQNPLEDWNRVQEFKDRFNNLFPNGLIYSPIPYSDEHVSTFNCNTYSQAVLDAVFHQTGQQNSITCIPYSLGGQTFKDGRKLNEFINADNASQIVTEQWEYVKTTHLDQQNFWARLLRTDGYGKILSQCVDKPED